MTEGFENLGVIIEQCMENIPHVVVLNRQAVRSANRLGLFKKAFVAFLTDEKFLMQTDHVQKIKYFEKAVESLLDVVDRKLTVPLTQWNSFDDYTDAINVFQLMTTEIVKINNELSLKIPLSFIVDSWQDTIDAQIDWKNGMSDLENGGCSPTKIAFFQAKRPLGPCFKQIDARDIIEIHDINFRMEEKDAAKRCLVIDEDDDDTPPTTPIPPTPGTPAPPFASVCLAVASKAPVCLKKVHADMVRGGDTEGGLLQLGYAYSNCPPSNYLLRVIGICQEAQSIKSLTTYRDEECHEDGRDSSVQASLSSDTFSSVASHTKSNTRPSPYPTLLGVILPLAPLGNLHDFLLTPPDEFLIDEKTLCSQPFSAGGTLPPHIKATILADVCSGLAVLHEHGLIHGRLHDRNILIFQKCRAKLSDFGLSHMMSPGVAVEASKGSGEDDFLGQATPRGGIGCGWDVRWQAPEDVLRPVGDMSRNFIGRGGEARYSCQTTAVSVLTYIYTHIYTARRDGREGGGG